MRAVVSRSGGVTIPKALRDQLDIRPGDVLQFRVEGERLLASRVSGGDPIERVYGTLRLDKSTDELMRELRGDFELT